MRAVDVVGRQLARNLGIAGARHRARRHRVATGGLSIRLAAAVDDLGDDLATVSCTVLGEFGEAGNELVAIGEQLGRLLPAIGAHRDVAGDDETDPTVGKLAVDIDQPFVDASVGVAEPLPRRRPDQSIAKFEAVDGGGVEYRFHR